MASIEKRLEKQLRERIKKMGGLALKIWSASFTGLPDRMVLLPGGRIHFVELKDLNQTPTPRQLTVHRQLRRLGFLVHTINNQFALTNFLNQAQHETDNHSQSRNRPDHDRPGGAYPSRP